MNWANDAQSTGYKFNSRSKNYKSHIKKMEQQTNLGHAQPFVNPVILPPDNLKLDVTCFDFTSSL